MSDPGSRGLRDEPDQRVVRERLIRHRGAKWDVVSDLVLLDSDTPVLRDVVVHPGAVGVLPLDDDGRVLLIRQYRHPVARRLWEIPAGLLDVPGEPLVECARRELYEEAHLRAERYDVLLDLYASPGMSSEGYRVFLARGLTHVPDAERHEAEHEERELELQWLPLDEAVAAVLEGRIGNAMAVAAVLAGAAGAAAGWASLRPADTPWEQPGPTVDPSGVKSTPDR